MALTCGEQWYGQDKLASTPTLGPLVFVLYGCIEPETVLVLMLCWETVDARLCCVNELLPDNRLFRGMRHFSCETLVDSVILDMLAAVVGVLTALCFSFVGFSEGSCVGACGPKRSGSGCTCSLSEHSCFCCSGVYLLGLWLGR